MSLIAEPFARTMSHLEDQLAQDEGYRRYLYRCPAGRLTIGFGWMIEDGIEADEALILMRYRLYKLDAALTRQLSWYPGIATRRRHALLNMAYQLGLAGLLGFRRMLAAAGRGDWATAAQEALDSKWAREDAPARARRVATMLEQG